MKEHSGLPVAGYQPQTDTKVQLVNSNKEMEERLLRLLDDLKNSFSAVSPNGTRTGEVKSDYDYRWLSIARTHFEQGFMALNRAIFQPSRVKLPEDYI